MRIALLCPYSWTYPGGVTRHVEALAEQLIASGHEARVLAPFDPDDALSRRLHRGARPEPRGVPDYLVPLGRTLGIEANGAVSNLSLFPEAVTRMRRELGKGQYDVVHIHEPVVPIVCWDALCSTTGAPLVGTFHTYSHNVLTNGAAWAVGAARRMNRLHARIAVSEAAFWTARRFFGGRYTIVPNGVSLSDSAELDETSYRTDGQRTAAPRALRILFIGQAVERKGLPVLLKAFEALRDHVPATLTLVGAGPEQVAPLLLDDRGVHALGKVSERRKAAALAQADVLCAPSLHGESFGMVLTEAFASATPVVASDITGYRDVVRDGVDGILVPPNDPIALAEALRSLALAPERSQHMARRARERAKRFAWPQVAAEVAAVYEQAIAVPAPVGSAQRAALRLGFASADLQPLVPPSRRLPSLEPATRPSPVRRALLPVARAGLALVALAAVALALLALQRIGVAQVLASIISSRPSLLAAALGLMGAAMVLRGVAWHAILLTAPTTRGARRRDALRGTFVGVLMSATLPVRLGETSRALIVARRLGRVRETLPAVLGTIISQTLLNLLALCILGAISFATIDLGHGYGILLILALLPAAGLLTALLAPVLISPPAHGEPSRVRLLLDAIGVLTDRVRDGFALFRHSRAALTATGAQLAAWSLQALACWLLLAALGLDRHVSLGAAAAVLFAVNATSFTPLTPANVGVFQAACVAVLAGAYHVSGPDALAYGIILQALELATAAAMGIPALMGEGLSWRQLRLRTIHAAPVKIGPLPAGGQAAVDSGPSSS